MKLHRNARLTPRGRLFLVERVCDQQVALAEAGVKNGSLGTAQRAGLSDRSSAPHRVPRRTSEDRVVAIAALRRLRMTAAELSELLGMPISTGSAVLLRIGRIYLACVVRLGGFGWGPCARPKCLELPTAG